MSLRRTVSRVTTDTELLTEAGWPRPRYAGWPVPWVSPQGELSQMDAARERAAATGAVCAVCGRGYQTGARAVAIVKLEPGQVITAEQWPTGEITAMDNAIMHLPCARLAYSTCPVLLALRSEGVLLPVDVPANASQLELDDDGHLRALFDAADCRPLPLPETEWPDGPEWPA